MAKRIVVLFFPAPRADKPKQHPKMLLRHNPACVDDLVKQCELPDIYDLNGRGTLLIGREHEHHIVTQDSRHPNAALWEGVKRSGDFPTFVRQHAQPLFQASTN